MSQHEQAPGEMDAHNQRKAHAYAASQAAKTDKEEYDTHFNAFLKLEQLLKQTAQTFNAAATPPQEERCYVALSPQQYFMLKNTLAANGIRFSK